MSSDEKSVLLTEKLTIGYDEDLIRDISLKVTPGRIVTLIGPNGCGKSTLLRTVSGHLKSRGGLVFLDGRDSSLMSSNDRARILSLVMTRKSRPDLMTCREVVETGRYPYTGMMGRLSDEDEQAVDEAMEMTGIAQLSDRMFTNISDGQAQRVMLAAAIARKPRILVLDEPVSYLDIRYKIDILKKIRDLAATGNVAVLMSVHEPEIAMNLADTVVAMGEGQVQRIGSPAEVFEESFIRRLYSLGDEDVSLLGSLPWYEGPEGERGAGGSADLPHANSERSKRSESPESAEDSQSNSDRTTDHEIKKGGSIMVMGTMSGVGKSVITAGLCRIFANEGLKVAPFKSQNMANNSFITDEGLEMGRAQVMQAQCAKTRPRACMNPVLLKPVSDCGSQVVVNGKSVGNMRAKEYHGYKKELIPVICDAFCELKSENDVVIVEGAGSPAEINLRENDIVNMGLAEMIDAPVILVGDIDRGGVFAQLIGTLDLLTKEERSRVRGLIINKFRGDKELLLPGIRQLEERAKCPVIGVVPLMDLDLEDEDSLSDRFRKKSPGAFDIVAIRFPHISNYTDLDVFEQVEGVSVRYITDPADMLDPDLLVLPGSKNTIGDMKWMDEKGISGAVKRLAAKGTPVLGICGGFQMLGRGISDPENAESGGNIEGLALLPIDTVMKPEKTQRPFEGFIDSATGILQQLAGCKVTGYEIHMGMSVPYDEVSHFTSDDSGYCRDNIYGTYVHGLFDRKEIASAIITAVAARNKKDIDPGRIKDLDELRDRQYDILAETLKNSVDMAKIYEIAGISPVREAEHG